MTSKVERPKFEPVSCIGQNSGTQWVSLISCEASCPDDLFEAALETLVHHPEYNSTLILRSETVSTSETDFPSLTPDLPDKIRRQCIQRRLLPRRPGRDEGLDQYCTFYSDSEASCIDTLVLTPIPPADGRPLPYYHPTVHHIAFRHLPGKGIFRIDVDPLPDVDTTDINSRLYRTCLSLLETLHRYGWGVVSQFKKRVHHDRLVPREPYQDLYLIMRERHKHLVDTWQEATDPLKHVFEDIGIATFLMLLWKDTYTAPDTNPVNEPEPWKSWPRPPGGFLDLGCGNGLLTHILVSEGYEGSGIDVRARTSWSHYPDSTQASLRVHALEPLNEERSEIFKPGVFFIGNHADELTPWVPLLATLHAASGYLSIPCCAWTFDARYERSMALFSLAGENESQDSEQFIAGLHLGGDGGNTSGYSMYRIWLASLSSHCGWEIECETLRIPSTRNWALVGRRHVADCNDNVRAIMQSVRERGAFKTRKPEGKAGEH